MTLSMLEHRWYAVQTTSGHENKVQRLIQRKIDADPVPPEDRLIRQAIVPTEDVVEIKNGKKVTVERKKYPGYVLVEMVASQDTLHEVSAIQGVIKFVGNTIPKEGNLIVATTHLFSRRFNINCHTEHEVVDVRAGDKVVRVRNLVTMEEHDRPYDALVLATGASALVPPIAGVDLNVTTGKPSTPGVFVLRTIPDSNQVRIGCLLPAACCLLPAACCQSRVARLRGWTIVLFTAEETAVL